MCLTSHTFLLNDSAYTYDIYLKEVLQLALSISALFRKMLQSVQIPLCQAYNFLALNELSPACEKHGEITLHFGQQLKARNLFCVLQCVIKR